MVLNKISLVAGLTAMSLVVAGVSETTFAQDKKINYNSNSALVSEPMVVYRYGANINQMKLEYVAKIMNSRGIFALTVSGYAKDDCVLLVIRGKEIGLYGADDIRRTIGRATIREVAGKPLRRTHHGNCRSVLSSPTDQSK